jgi:glycosyltransferase involved in cell wall biosynthesis
MTSIVIPSSGREGSIERTLAAVAVPSTNGNQVEVVIVDDTPDQSLATAIDALREGLAIRIVRGPRTGPGAARNAGAQAARGDLLIFIDDDCSPEPQWLSAYQSEFARYPEALLASPISDGLPDNRWSQAYHVILDYLYDAPSCLESAAFYTRLLMRAANEERRRAFVFMAILIGQAAVACGLLYEMSAGSRSDGRENP